MKVQKVAEARNDGLQMVRDLYDRYANMLFGYIMEIVKDRAQAEQHLHAFFQELPAHIDDLANSGSSLFCRMQKLVKSKLSANFNDQPTSLTPVFGGPIKNNKYLSLLTAEHKCVFCGIHYQGKTVTVLAAELAKTEDAIRLLLKEAFIIIRKGHQL